LENIDKLFQARKENFYWNTSYPIDPQDWESYRVRQELPFMDDKNLSFYLHIPFCKQLCLFCEYTRMLCPNEEIQKLYIHKIENDIERFKERYDNISLLGFDIGGGTPTSLSENCFTELMITYQRAIEGILTSANYEPSIEGTFNTLSDNKLIEIVNSGIYRLSLGVQSSSTNVLREYKRGVINPIMMDSWIQKAISYGVRKINLDFMYGLEGQNQYTIDEDLQLISFLSPQQVTLYEFRTNMVPQESHLSKEELYVMYTHYYNGLISLGYNARFGQNTFSRDISDLGLSSYLRERMINAAPYKGFGLSAQSMSSLGVSYNIGKLSSNPKIYLSESSYNEQYTYLLPSKEMLAKYFAVSAYFGAFSISKAIELGASQEALKKIIDYCVEANLLYVLDDDQVCISKAGFKYYGAVFSLFYNMEQFDH